MDTSGEQERRLTAYRRKRQVDPDFVVKVENRNWEYIPCQPMAGDTELLEQLGMKPEDCKAVDCYWHVGDDVVYLQVKAPRHDFRRPTGMYARWAGQDLPMLHVVAVVERDPVDREVVEEVMAKMAAIGLESEILSKRHLGSKLTRIDR